MGYGAPLSLLFKPSTYNSTVVRILPAVTCVRVVIVVVARSALRKQFNARNCCTLGQHVPPTVVANALAACFTS